MRLSKGTRRLSQRARLHCGRMIQPPALILAAGRGERMRPLSDALPKPLLRVRGKPLIEWHLIALAAAGVRQVVINTAWLEEQFPATLGDGLRWGLSITYSFEGRDHGGALETAGGMRKALPLLGDVFWLVSGDVFIPGFSFEGAAAQRFAAGDDDAHLWLVPNPSYHASGDFALTPDGRVNRGDDALPFTYANLALVRARLVASLTLGQPAPLGPLLFASAAAQRLSGERLTSEWHNLGTPDQLHALNQGSRGREIVNEARG